MEAMESIKAAPDLIPLDINMPGMDGLELCRQIRDKISCPILFLTAKAEEQDRVNGLLSGGDDYIFKALQLKRAGSQNHFPSETGGTAQDKIGVPVPGRADDRLHGEGKCGLTAKSGFHQNGI